MGRKVALLLPLLAMTWSGVTTAGQYRLINGQEVPSGQFREVVRIKTDIGDCSATIVGPRVILTSAHCAGNGTQVTFQFDGKEYKATITRSSLFPKKPHDIAVGLTSEPIQGAVPSTIGGKASTGLSVLLVGYGCTKKPAVGEKPQVDGKLRMGYTEIVGFTEFDMTSRKAGGAALCIGDSGGPAYWKDSQGKLLLLGVNSSGTMVDQNWSTRTDLEASQTFLKGFADTHNVTICGIKGDCSQNSVTPAPTCTLAADPGTVKLGESVKISLVGQGQITSAQIDGTPVSFPTGSVTLKPTSEGQFRAKGEVTGPGGSGQCEVSYTVQKPSGGNAPSCTLTATPEEVKMGETVTLELKAQGEVHTAMIDNFAVTFPIGKRLVVASAKGSFTANGYVAGPQGNGQCRATYQVVDGSTPAETPNFAVVPAYCGENKFLESGVSQVCIGVVKKENPDLKLTQVVLVTYRDSTREAMPILARKTRPKDALELTTKEDLWLYANQGLPVKDFLVLDTRSATLTHGPIAGTSGDVPVAIEGRTSTGKAFVVEKLSPFGVSP